MNGSRHTIVFLAMVVGVISLLELASLPTATQLLLLAPIIAVLGLPHGALDFEIARALFPLSNMKAAARFVAIYLGAAAMMLSLWLIAPGFALAAFLAYSALHFSDDWTTSEKGRGAIAGGLLAVALPVATHPEQVAALFAFLVPAPVADMVARGVAVVGWIAIPLALLAGYRQSTTVRTEWIALAASAILLPPLVHFAVYFCGLHSPRHFRSVVHTLGLSTAAGVRAALLPTTAILLACLIATGFFLAQHVDLDTTLMRLVFVTLACLTVPHMLLVDRLIRLRSAE
ncbi:Brp/Blh family beta-carotene 15,15'-dioxygenase [Salinisphaera sp. LB1]|uniref:Brp/Blh family beta-carotene 15,15'-dioxygenase n=1 Tax=Salinisphaera sp. LB1 TaxID=2183911 RepID=UPI000D705C97|nr:Brp/Blh family beta-carotene 15,15'-dioxygenase [Salinisphaera sp. LB1]